MSVGTRYADALAASRAGAVLVTPQQADAPGPATRIVVEDPARAMLQAARLLHPGPDRRPMIDPTARIAPGAVLGEGARIGPYAVVGRITAGARLMIGPHAVLEDDVTVGDDVRIDAHVVIHDGTVLGDRVWCKAGAILGGEGFGFASGEEGHLRVPQVGGCVIGDDVEIGSGTCIDRGSLDDTVVAKGSKLDNLVHLGHNVRIGEHCLVMAGVGISGSTRVGDRVIIAGHAGIAGHLTIGDGARIGAKSGVISNIKPGEAVSGYPARPHRELLRAVAAMYRLTPHLEALVSLAEERTHG